MHDNILILLGSVWLQFPLDKYASNPSKAADISIPFQQGASHPEAIDDKNQFPDEMDNEHAAKQNHQAAALCQSRQDAQHQRC